MLKGNLVRCGKDVRKLDMCLVCIVMFVCVCVYGCVCSREWRMLEREKKKNH